MAYQINLEQFEGPFDLLLHLIQKKKIDIYDIFISEITGEYLQTIRHWQEMDMEIASEFVMMASRLMEIKSRMLLYGNLEENTEIEEEKEELLAQLIEYQTFKKVAAYFKERNEYTQGAIGKEPEYYPELSKNEEIEIDGDILASALKKMMEMYREDHQYKKYFGELTKDPFTVEEKVELLITKLEREMGGPLDFSQLIVKGFRQEVVVAFQAMLTCYKSGKIRLSQSGLFGEIRMYLCE